MRKLPQLAAITILAFTSLSLGFSSPAFAQTGTNNDSTNSGPIRCMSTRCQQLGNSLQATVIVRKEGSRNFYRSTIDTNTAPIDHSIGMPLGGLEPGKYSVTLTNVRGRIVSYHPSLGPIVHRLTKKDVGVAPSSFVIDGTSTAPQIKLLVPQPVFVMGK